MGRPHYNAIVSGRAGVAMLVDGPAISSFHANQSDPVPRSADEFHLLFGMARDFEFLRKVSQKEVTERLSLAIRREQSLDCWQILLDAEYPTDIRSDAAADLAELLIDASVAEQLESVIFSAPLPSVTDILGAQTCVRSVDSAVSDGLQRLRQLQPTVRAVRETWNTAAESKLTDREREEADAACVRAGAFRTIVLAVDDKHRLGSAFLPLFNHPVLKSRLSEHTIRQLLLAWQSSLAELGFDRPQHNELIVGQEDWEEDAEQTPKAVRSGFDRRAAGEQAQQQVLRIAEQIKAGNLTTARRWVGDLITWQTELHQGNQFASKSLCNLAIRAQELGHFRFQLELAQRATELANDDAWAWCQVGKARLNCGKFGEALKAYRIADQFGEVVVAKTGAAEVLKAMGRFPEALDAYQQAQAAHPEDVVAKNGAAEVLKVMGRFPEALDAYQRAQAAHPEDVVAKNGAAEVLRVMGRFLEALDAYQQTQAAHPENVVAKNGAAEVLKAMGRYQDALDAYRQAQAAHPADVVAKTGAADVLRVMGRLEDALAAYEEVCSARPENMFARIGLACVLIDLERIEDVEKVLAKIPSGTRDAWIAEHIRGMLLLRGNRFDEAIAIFQHGHSECPFSGQRVFFRTALATARLGRREYAAAAELVATMENVGLSDPVNALRTQIYGLQNQTAGAIESYRQLNPPRTQLASDLFTELKLRFVDQREGQHSDVWLLQRQVQFQMEFISHAA